jgi:hypothetical protein
VRVENHPDINRLDAIAPLKKAMTQTTTVFHLKVQQVGQACLFELSWGQGQQLSVTLSYPEKLNTLYDEWNSIYLTFYKTALADKAALRGRVAATGSISPPPADWHAKLVQAQGKLLCEFHQWLRQGELYQIHSRIVQAAVDLEKKTVQEGKKGHSPAIEVFLACNSIELERLPWEAWEIGTGFAAPGKIRFVRMPVNIQEPPMPPQGRRRRARILAVLGDDTGLNFQSEREALRSLSPEIEFVGWQPGKNIDALKAEIVNAISDERGWDILFFAGHSNEACLGGQLGIAPNVSLFLNEIAHPLKIAIERGLQFALFNSCKGLSIANALIDLGLSQVAVMREPIHNRVAEEFFVRFVQNLTQYKDVHESMLAACQYLKLEKHLTYPSAYLTPSLFRHPASRLFRLKPTGIEINRWLPTKKEAIAIATLMLLSLLPSVREFAVERRIWMQAFYRSATNQVPAATSPPVLLVQIDRDSLTRANIDARKINPMDRTYLSSLVDRLSTRGAKVIGLDYVLDSPTPEDRAMARTIQKAVDQKGTWFVFAALKQGNTEQGVIDKVATLDQSLQGYINAPLWYVPLLSAGADCAKQCPFSYLLALTYSLNDAATPDLPRPQQYVRQTDLRTRLIEYLNRGNIKSEVTAFLHQLHLLPITSFSRQFEQMWLYPIIDFSIPPTRAYKPIPAWQVQENGDPTLLTDTLKQQVVLIAAGGYDQAGVTQPGSDNFPIPMAIAYWRSKQSFTNNLPVFTGAEAHAYMIHHLLTKRLVVPIPDLWMLGVVAFLGKGVQLVLLELQAGCSRRRGLITLSGATAIFGLVGLQVYISAAVLVPWFFPSVMFWVYLLPVFWRKYHA